MAAVNIDSYYLSKVQNDFASLTKKIELSRNFIELIMNTKLKHYLHTNSQMTQDEYCQLQLLICRIHDDTTLTMRTERLAINDYFTDGLVDQNDLKLNEVSEAYIEKRNEYFNVHEKAVKMWQSSLHMERRVISTPKMIEPCSICTKKHSKQCALMLCCNHIFGSKCFYRWADACVERKTVVTCPICRAVNV